MVARTMPGVEKMICDPVLGEPGAEPAVLAVDEDQGEADDHRRERQRQADQELISHVPCFGRPADERHRAHDAEDRVDGDRDADRDQGQLEGGDERGVGQRLPHGLEPVPERVVDDHRAREGEEQAR